MRERLSDDEVLKQIAAGRAQARKAVATEPRALRARYDRERELVEIELTNGFFFSFPAQADPGLAGATADQLSEVEVSPSGLGLHWEKLDADLSLPALLQRMFGRSVWMGEMGREGGRARSQEKTQAARTNGLKGGRPRKVIQVAPPVSIDPAEGRLADRPKVKR